MPDSSSIAAIDPRGKFVYYCENIDDEGIGDLYKANISGGELTDKKRYDSDVYTDGITLCEDGEAAYYKLSKIDDSGYTISLHYKGKLIGEDVLSQGTEPHLKNVEREIYFLVNSDEDTEGVLMHSNNGEVKKVSDGVINFFVMKDKSLVYFKENMQDFSSIDLYAYNKGKTKKVIDGISVESLYIILQETYHYKAWRSMNNWWIFS